MYKVAGCGYFEIMENKTEAWIDGLDIRVTVRDVSFRLRRPADLESIWENMAETTGTIPYWVELWPASIVLADFLFDRAAEIKGRMCCDLGCGLGLTTLLAHRLQSEIIGVDVEAAALEWCALNAALNNCARPGLVCMDICRTAIRRDMIWRAWAGDIIYERAMFRPFLECLAWILAPRGCVWIAEPGRGLFLSFLELAQGSGWRCEALKTVKVKALYDGEPGKQVTIWELTRSNRS